MSSLKPNTPTKNERVKNWRNWFLVLYIISSLAFFVVAINYYFRVQDFLLEWGVLETSAALSLSPSVKGLSLTLVVSVSSLLTSVSALGGLILTANLAWRKEERERKSFELDNAKKELEIAKLRDELEKATQEKKLIVER